MHVKPMQHRRHGSTMHVIIDLPCRTDSTQLPSDAEQYLKLKSLNSQDLLESATLSGLEQRLYHRFKDSIRNERLQDANPIEEIEKQNAKIGHVRNKLSQSSMMSQITDANPETSQLSNKLTALEKTYLNPKAGKVITRKNNRKILGDLSQNDLVPAQLTEEISAAISALPSCQKIHKMFKWHNELLRTAQQIKQTNDQLSIKRMEQATKLQKVEKMQVTLREQITEANNEIAHVQNMCRQLEQSIEDILEKQRAKWMLELEDEERILERLNMF